MKDKRTSYQHFSELCMLLRDYASSSDNNSVVNLVNFIREDDIEMPLPSGRRGNALAVSLEMNMYVGALFMIENSDFLGLDLNCYVAYDKSKCFTATDLFDLTKEYFSTKKIDLNSNLYNEHAERAKYIDRNIDAFYELEDLIGKRENKIIKKVVKNQTSYQ